MVFPVPCNLAIRYVGVCVFVCVCWGPVGVFGPGQRQVCKPKQYKTINAHARTHTFGFAINKQSLLEQQTSYIFKQTDKIET